LRDDELDRLIRSCSGSSFRDRRDLAIIRVLLDTGVRVSELVGIKLGDIDHGSSTMLVTGKGNRPRIVVYGDATATALRRYLRARSRHRRAAEAAVWVSERGPLTHHGVRDLLARRGREAGVPGVSPHRF